MGAVRHWENQNDRSMEGTRSLDWHLHKLFIHIVWTNLLQRTFMRNVPSQPHSGPRISPFVCHFQCASNTKSISQTQLQSLSRSQNQTLFCCLLFGMDCRQLLTSSGHKTSVPQRT